MSLKISTSNTSHYEKGIDFVDIFSDKEAKQKLQDCKCNLQIRISTKKVSNEVHLLVSMPTAWQ